MGTDVVAGLAELGADDVAKENAGADAEEGEANASAFAATNVGDAPVPKGETTGASCLPGTTAV